VRVRPVTAAASDGVYAIRLDLDSETSIIGASCLFNSVPRGAVGLRAFLSYVANFFGQKWPEMANNSR
jgi:hypothetical protein